MPQPWWQRMKAWQWAVLGQYGFAGLLLVVPFGFDHRSSWGLDFDHFLLAMVALVILIFQSLFAATLDRSIAGMLLALALPAGVVGFVCYQLA